jgi:hypothetical protein
VCTSLASLAWLVRLRKECRDEQCLHRVTSREGWRTYCAIFVAVKRLKFANVRVHFRVEIFVVGMNIDTGICDVR